MWGRRRGPALWCRAWSSTSPSQVGEGGGIGVRSGRRRCKARGEGAPAWGSKRFSGGALPWWAASPAASRPRLTPQHLPASAACPLPAPSLLPPPALPRFVPFPVPPCRRDAGAARGAGVQPQASQHAGGAEPGHGAGGHLARWLQGGAWGACGGSAGWGQAQGTGQGRGGGRQGLAPAAFVLGAPPLAECLALWCLPTLPPCPPPRLHRHRQWLTASLPTACLPRLPLPCPAPCPGQVELVEPPAGAAIGERLRVEGYGGEHDGLEPDQPWLNPKKKVFEAVSAVCADAVQPQCSAEGWWV